MNSAMNRRTLEETPIAGKRVLIRVDFNVPMDEQGEIREDRRIRATLPTIRWCLARGARGIVLASHRGRPGGSPNPGFSMAPVASRLSELLNDSTCDDGCKITVTLAPDCIGARVEDMVEALSSNEILLLENLRFHVGETDNDPVFAQSLARLADVIVNDAFGMAHRAHASNVGIAQWGKPVVAGFLMAREIEYLDSMTRSPKKPLVAALGGSKISTKIKMVDAFLEKMDSVLIGGGMAFAFLAAIGHSVGLSRLEADGVEIAARILAKAEEKDVAILLPVDVVVAREMKSDAETRVVSVREISDGWMGLDIGPKTVQRFSEVVKLAGTVVWNGPMGVFEMASFAAGTVGFARAVAESRALSIVGGGDTDAAVQYAKVAQEISYISTGGGAFLAYLEGNSLPGLAVLS